VNDNSNIGDLVKHIEGDSSLTPAQKRVLIKRVRVFPEDDEIAEAQAELDQESAKAAADVLRWKVAQSDARLVRVRAELEVAQKKREEAREKVATLESKLMQADGRRFAAQKERDQAQADHAETRAVLDVMCRERDEARAKHRVASGYDDAGQFLGALVIVPDSLMSLIPRRVEQVRKTWDNPLTFPRVEVLVEGRSWYLLDQVQVIDKPSGG